MATITTAAAALAALLLPALFCGSLTPRGTGAGCAAGVTATAPSAAVSARPYHRPPLPP